MSVIRELVTVIGFDYDDVALEKAEAGFKALLKTSSGIVAGASAVAAGLFAITKATANAGDAARDTARRTGLTVETVQELGYAAQQSGVSAGELEQGLKFLQRSAVEATKGSKAASAAFAQLGVRIRGADGKVKPSEKLLGEIADRLQAIKDPATRTALAMRVFGRSGTTMLPLLAEGSKGIDAMRSRAQDLGFVLSAETAEASDKFNDSFADLGMVVTGVSRRLGTKLLPIFTRLIDKTTEWFIANRELIDKGLDMLVKVVDYAAGALEFLAKLIDENRAYMVSLVAIGVLPLVKALGALALAQLRVIAGPALMVIGWLAFAAILALVAEDIYQFVTGGKSLLGDLFAEFLDKPPGADDHWMLNVLRTFLDLVRMSIQGWQQLTGLVSKWTDEDWADLYGFITGMSPEELYARKQRGGRERTLERVTAAGLQNFEAPFASIPAFPYSPDQPPPLLAGGNTTIQVTVENPPGASPTQVGDSAAAGVQKGIKQAHDQTRSRVLR